MNSIRNSSPRDPAVEAIVPTLVAQDYPGVRNFHAFCDALTVIALAYTSMLEGAVLTETVFSWPGIGRYLTTALFAGDTTAVMGGTLLIGVCFVLINNLTDLLVRATDPRVR